MPRLLAGPLGALRDAERALLRAANRTRARRIGWVTAHTLGQDGRTERLGHLGPFLDMRVSNHALWINANDAQSWCEIYDPRQRYHTVVFVKAMDAACQREAERIHGYGGRVVFDANVNYYEVWGEYDVPGTQPTPEQQRDAVAMTTLADVVIAGSSYLKEQVCRINTSCEWVPDNVDMRLFGGVREHVPGTPLRLVWSGIAKKAAHLLLLRDALQKLQGLELLLVSDERPAAMAELERLVACRYLRYTDSAYARALSESDVIISPKRLVNAYEMGHTEYKITLGMAVGLPAVASRQRSYVEAISHRGGGILAESTEDWVAALTRLRDAGLRSELGGLARATVQEHYATPVVAARYHRALGAA
jgi:glycosyltransferase involved in cell wall biosynthesis